MDAEQWSIAPYTEADYQRQFDLGDDLYGDRGRQLQDDALNYVAGVNQYIAEARLDPTKMPGEYAALGRPQGPDDWKVTDLFSTASLVGGIFGKGGGRELAESQLLDAFKGRFGAKKGRTLWEQFAAFDDRDAPTTVQGKRFPYQTRPKHKAKGAEEPPDRGSFKALDVARSRTPRPRAAACCRAATSRCHPGPRPCPGSRRCRACRCPSSARCPRRCPTRCSCRAPTRPAATRSPSSARRSPTSPRRSSWRRTCTGRASTPRAPPSPA